MSSSTEYDGLATQETSNPTSTLLVLPTSSLAEVAEAPSAMSSSIEEQSLIDYQTNDGLATQGTSNPTSTTLNFPSTSSPTGDVEAPPTISSSIEEVRGVEHHANDRLDTRDISNPTSTALVLQSSSLTEVVEALPTMSSSIEQDVSIERHADNDVAIDDVTTPSSASIAPNSSTPPTSEVIEASSSGYALVSQSNTTNTLHLKDCSPASPLLLDLTNLDSLSFEAREAILARLVAHDPKIILSLPPTNKNNPSSSTPSKQRPACMFLDRLLPEMREKIYGYLLINPLLGETRIYRGTDPWISSIKYDLSPAILGTCQKIHGEASHILYGRNTFIMNTIGHYHSETYERISPLTRYGVYEGPSNANLTRVRKWKLVVSSEILSGSLVGSSLASLSFLCNAISIFPPRSIEVLLIPQEVGDIWAPAEEKRHFDLRELFAPLRVLRGLESLQFRDATIEEAQNCVRQDFDFSMDLTYPMEAEHDLCLDLQKTVMASGPLESMQKMNDSLNAYAQAFERFEPFRYKMRTGKEPSRFRSVLCPQSRRYLDYGIVNPFAPNDYSGSPWHPVEAGLRDARLASQGIPPPEQRAPPIDDFSPDSLLMAFKSQRANVLNYLEDQYQRIAVASNNLIAFIKIEKSGHGFLSQVYPVTSEQILRNFRAEIGMALALVDEYESALSTRNIPLEIKAAMKIYHRWDSDFRTHQIELNKNYGTGQARELSIKTLNGFFRNNLYEGFVQLFHEIVDELDSQYLEIRHARKNLFHFDILDQRLCAIDVSSGLSDEKVNWNVSEPILGPFGESYYD